MHECQVSLKAKYHLHTLDQNHSKSLKLAIDIISELTLYRAHALPCARFTERTRNRAHAFVNKVALMSSKVLIFGLAKIHNMGHFHWFSKTMTIFYSKRETLEDPLFSSCFPIVVKQALIG